MYAQPRIEVISGVFATGPHGSLDLQSGPKSAVGGIIAGLGRTPVGEKLVACETGEAAIFAERRIRLYREEPVEEVKNTFDRLGFTECRESPQIAEENRHLIPLGTDHIEVLCHLLEHCRGKIEPEHGVALKASALFGGPASSYFENYSSSPEQGGIDCRWQEIKMPHG